MRSALPSSGSGRCLQEEERGGVGLEGSLQVTELVRRVLAGYRISWVGLEETLKVTE